MTYMKHVFTTILLCLVAMVATAETWTDANGVTYDFGTNDVNGKRKAYINKIENCPKNLVIPDKVYNGTTAYEVYQISGGQNLFSSDDKKKVENIVMPNTIISIGYHAFEYCTSLKQITLSTSLESIDYNAFYYCTSLRTIDIPATTIGKWAFIGCSSLQKRSP